MKASQFQPYHPSRKQISLLLLIMVYLAINFFRIGGDAVVINLNNLVVTPLALGVTLLALMLWRQIAIGSENRLLWSGLTMGWALWTVAEIWWAIASLLGEEIPYPSWADVFWLAGYIPMYIALWYRLRSLPKMDHPGQRIGIWAIGLVTVGFTIPFIFVPIFRNSDLAAITESILSLLYPLADIILLLLVQRIFFAYQGGMYGRAWIWLAAGFVFFALGDLAYSYATAINLYYPNEEVNYLSTFGVDIPYNLSYLLMLVGLFHMRSIQDSHQTYATLDIPIALVPNTHLLVFTKGDDSVLDVGRNYSLIFDQEKVKGKTLAETLQISTAEADMLLQEIKAKHILQERTFSVTTRFGQKQALISGVTVLSPKHAYSGVILLVRLLLENYTADEVLTEYEKAMTRSLLEKTGAGQKRETEIKDLLTNYYESFLRGFYNRAISEGGSVIADAFISELQSVCRQHAWLVGIQHSDPLLDTRSATLAETQEALPILFETARKFVVTIVDQASVDRIIQDIGARFDEVTSRNIDFCSVASAALN